MLAPQGISRCFRKAVTHHETHLLKVSTEFFLPDHQAEIRCPGKNQSVDALQRKLYRKNRIKPEQSCMQNGARERGHNQGHATDQGRLQACPHQHGKRMFKNHLFGSFPRSVAWRNTSCCIKWSARQVQLFHWSQRKRIPWENERYLIEKENVHLGPDLRTPQQGIEWW